MDDEENDMDREFKGFWEEVSCFVVKEFAYAERCHFVKNATDCYSGTNFIPYMRLMSCDFNCLNKFMELIFVTFFVALCAELLLAMGYLVDMYYSPALKVVSQLLHMNEHLAGVTLLAFGNSSPDLFANLSDIRGENPVFANSMSSALFVSMFTGGLVCYLSPFKMNAHATVRDILFFILGVSLLEYTLHEGGAVSIEECIILLGVYVFYLIVNGLDLYLMRVTMRMLARQIAALKNEAQTPEVEKKLEDLYAKYNDMAGDSHIEIVERESGIFKRSSDAPNRRPTFTYNTSVNVRPQSVDASANRDVSYNSGNSKNKNLFREFFLALRPIEFAEWRASSMFIKAFLIAKAPIVFICALYIPIVDYELDKHGWCKLLNCLHIFVNPAVTLMMGMALFRREGHVAWYTNLDLTYALYTSPLILVSLIVFFHSRTDVPPFYHSFFTIMNLTGSMFLIFICATEIDLIMGVVGNILDIPEDFMGVTINAVSGALGDLIANSSMALQGYEKMAYAAAIGGPFFTTLLATGSVFLMKGLSGMKATEEEQSGKYGQNAYIFLNLGLFTTLLWTSTLNFYARRSVGVYSLGLYALYIFFAVLIQQDIIHSFSSDSFLEII